MNTRERIISVLEGVMPDVTPFLVYDGMMDGKWTGLPQGDDLQPWRPFLDAGLGVMQHCNVFRKTEHGVTRRVETKQVGGRNVTLTRLETPAGTVEHRRIDGWQDGKWIHDEADYAVMKWIVEHTEIVPDYGRFDEYEAKLGNYGVTVTEAFRSPMQTINIDIAGTERFCLDYGLQVPGLFELYEALNAQFMRIIDLLAHCRGRYVKVLENPTMDMLGPDYYRRWLLPVYHEAMAVLNAAGKRVMMHFDSELSCVCELVAESPFQIIESLTEPPEGDMLYDDCRRSWPEKVLLGNINVGLYQQPRHVLKQAVREKLERAGRAAFAFEISEDLPANWQETVPAVLQALGL